MRKGYLLLLLVCAGFAVTLQSCRNDEYLMAAPAVANQSFVEQFDTMQNAYNRGWRWINRSLPVGPSVWTQAPGTASMSAYSCGALTREQLMPIIILLPGQMPESSATGLSLRH